MGRWWCVAASVVVVWAFGVAMAASDEGEPVGTNDRLGTLEWRSIGPARGGRVSSVQGVVGEPQTYYMGACGGGVWKTTNAGSTWVNITDGQLGTGSVGSIAVAPTDANVIYVGMGEGDIRGNASHGDGVYRSLDAGKTWEHVGLGDTRHIGRVVVHPRDENVVFVAALGHVFGPNAERGVFKSTDGGDSWERVLYIDDRTGAIDVAIDPNNPRVVFAGTWRVHRRPWELSSGGEGSGLWRSKDGGETWEECTKGLPEGMKGKVSVSVSPARRDLVYALVEAEDGGVFRSDDGGDSWRRVNEDRSLRQRAWYYTHIFADPNEAETVYVLNVQFHKSTDGGKTFGRIRVPHVDNHDLWIDPNDSMRMIEGNDGGANISFDGGATWSTQTNQTTAQFYRVTTDNGFPYRVYGAQQDNSTISVSSQGRPLRWERDAYSVGGGESGYIAVHPEDSDIVYAGSYMGWLTRYDHETGMSRSVQVWPENTIGWGAAELDYRFQWTFPIVLSPHDPEVLRVGAQMVFESRDRGETWRAISGDLTTNDKTKQAASGGPLTKDNTGVEYYCTVFTIAESPLEEGLIWAGTDDGLVHVTRDGGERWEDVTPSGMGDWPMISLVEASPHDAEKAYLAVTRYKMDDNAPYIYRTEDGGKTWDLIVEGIADGAFVRSIREDPVREGLLYAATETGMWYSLDDGGRWESLQLELPVVPVTDVAVRGDDVVISTQGRSFWILDDVSALRQTSAKVERSEVHLFEPGDVYRVRWDRLRVHWRLGEGVEGPALLEVLDAAGGVVRSFGKKGGGGADEDEEMMEWLGGSRRQSEDVPAEEGMNVFEWNLRHEGATAVPGAVGWPPAPSSGPQVAPGEYTVRLTVGGEVREASFEVLADPRSGASREDIEAQVALLLEVRDVLSDVQEGVNSLRSVRREIDSTVDRHRRSRGGGEGAAAGAGGAIGVGENGAASHGENGGGGAGGDGEGLAEIVVEEEGEGDRLVSEAKRIKGVLKEIEDVLIQSKSKSAQDPLNYPVMLNDKLGALMYSESAHAPTAATRAVFEKLRGIAEETLAELDRVMSEDVASFNELAMEEGVPAVVAPGAEEEEPVGAP